MSQNQEIIIRAKKQAFSRIAQNLAGTGADKKVIYRSNIMWDEFALLTCCNISDTLREYLERKLEAFDNNISLHVYYV